MTVVEVNQAILRKGARLIMIKLSGVLAVFLAALFSLPVLAADSGARAQFEELLGTYSKGLAGKDVDGVLDLYSSDPVFTPEYAPPAVGREAVRKAYEWVFATLKLDGHFIVHEAEVLGDTAWVRTSSTGRFTVIATGAEADVANSEFFLFKRQGGAWKIHRYIFTASVPPPQAK